MAQCCTKSSEDLPARAPCPVWSIVTMPRAEIVLSFLPTEGATMNRRTLGALGLVTVVVLMLGAAQGAAAGPVGTLQVLGASYQATGYRMILTAHFSWNQKNGEVVSAQGKATITGSLHRTQRVGRTDSDGMLVVVKKKISGAVTFPVRMTHTEHVTSKDWDGKTETCTGSAALRETQSVAGVYFKNAGRSTDVHTPVAVVWPIPDVFGCGMTSGLARDTVTSTTMLGELTKPRVVHLHAEATVPFKLPGAGSGSVDWEASVTLRRL
jgi:hypothetical protein